jgi:Ribbon-helix-helix protein, copG family.
MNQNMKQRMYITLYPDTIKKLIEISNKNHRSKSAMIEKLIQEFKE